MSENTTKPRGSVGIKRPAYEMSALSRKLLKVAEGSDPSGKSWYRKVTSTDELAKAIRDVPASGGTIYIVSGKYLVNNPLTIENKSNVTIIGAGLSAFLRGLNDGDLLAFKGRCLNCYVGNITVTPDKADPWHPVDQKSGSGIHFQGEGENFAVEYCAANNFPESCIKIEGKPDNPVRHANVSYCWGMCGKQAELSLIRCKGLRAYGNQWGSSFPNRPAVGAYFEYCSDGLYDFNYHWNNRHGIQLYQGCEDIKLTCNRAEQSQESGVVLGVKTGGGKPNRNLTMMGNTFHTNPELKPGDPGICADMLVRDTSDVKFIANQLYTWWDPRKFTHGVELDDASRNWLFDGNYIRDNTESAVKYNPAGGHIFKLNYFEPR